MAASTTLAHSRRRSSSVGEGGGGVGSARQTGRHRQTRGGTSSSNKTTTNNTNSRKSTQQHHPKQGGRGHVSGRGVPPYARLAKGDPPRVDRYRVRPATIARPRGGVERQWRLACGRYRGARPDVRGGGGGGMRPRQATTYPQTRGCAATVPAAGPCQSASQSPVADRDTGGVGRGDGDGASHNTQKTRIRNRAANPLSPGGSARAQEPPVQTT